MVQRRSVDGHTHAPPRIHGWFWLGPHSEVGIKDSISFDVCSLPKSSTYFGGNEYMVDFEPHERLQNYLFSNDFHCYNILSDASALGFSIGTWPTSRMDFGECGAHVN